MIKIIENILSNDELNYFYNFCDSITDYELDKLKPNAKFSWYKRKSVILSDTTKNKIFSVLEKNYGLKCKMTPNWVNIITPETNQNDGYHHDVADASIIIYLNDNFDGGEFEYIDTNREVKIIKPIKNTGILLAKNIFHRVKPVTKGRRYSMVSFFNVDDDFIKQKSII